MKEPDLAVDDTEGNRRGNSFSVPRKAGRVLVVDDEPVLLDVLVQLLSDAHTVEAATGGKEAVDRILSGGEYDVILCDLSMPDMHGLEVHAEVARARPDQAARFVFMSGGVSDDVVQQRLAALPNLLIEKPFDCRGIERIVV